MTYDCLVVGGGVIGLSVAYELSGASLRVCLIDRGTPGREASWAGAGVLPPCRALPDDSSLHRLAAMSCRLHAQWSGHLREETGIDNGYRACGGIYLARDPQQTAALDRTVRDWQGRGIAVERLEAEALPALEPALAPSHVDGRRRFAAAYLVPEEAQIRNPWHLRALLVACRKQGVEIMAGVAADGFETQRGRVTAVRTTAGKISADRVCLTCGCWTAALTADLGFTAKITPVRGQIVLLTTRSESLQRIITEGRRYLVPRPDGRILVGSTEEEVGYACHTTSAGVADLLGFALDVAPALSAAEVKTTWAGLRPQTADRAPYVGYLPELENVIVAAGHFRRGLQLSTGTARLVSQLVRGEPLEFDLEGLDPSRHERASDVEDTQDGWKV